jgi:hypothetical protein
MQFRPPKPASLIGCDRADQNAIHVEEDSANDYALPFQDTQSKVLHADTTPSVLTIPGVGLQPIRLLKPAGTRPEPAVSVPNANATRPRTTTDAEPELDPPLICFELNTFGTAPYGDRVPTKPVAN